MNSIDQYLPDDDSWECPTCLQPFPAEADYECGTCEAKASEHLRVTTMCRLLREVSGREAKLAVERDKYKALADRLAALVRRDRDRYGYGSATTNSVCGCSDCEYLRPLDEALAAWKEARSE